MLRPRWAMPWNIRDVPDARLAGLGKSRWLVGAQTLPKTITIGGAVVALLLAMVLIPYDYSLRSDGHLQPVNRRDVFAALDGTVERVLVKHGDMVEKGQLLAELQNTDLEVQMEDVLGERAAAQEQLISLDRSNYDEGKRLTVEERNRIAGQRSELKQKLASLDQQLTLYRVKKEKLKVVSPIRGEVTTWNLEQTLKLRPVRARPGAHERCRSGRAVGVGAATCPRTVPAPGNAPVKPSNPTCTSVIAWRLIRAPIARGRSGTCSYRPRFMATKEIPCW